MNIGHHFLEQIPMLKKVMLPRKEEQWHQRENLDQ